LPEKAKILNHMGSTELAANLFRITQTDEKLKKDKVKIKTTANATHYSVGKPVRQTMLNIGGTAPENLPPYPDVNKIESGKKTKTLL
jgi:DNA-damage-inducible protein D